MPPTLGHRLKQAREQKGLTLPDVAHSTRIPVVRLHDLEENSYTSFGGMMYAKKSLHAYARLLEVDATEVLEQFETPPLGGVQDYKYLVTNQGPWISSRRSSFEAPARSLPQTRSMAAFVMITGTVMLVGVGVLLGSAWFNQRNEVIKTEAVAAPVPETVVKAVPVPETSMNINAKKSWDTTEVSGSVPDAQVPSVSNEVYTSPNALVVVPPKALPVEDEPVKGRSKAKNKR